jgi:hypothetical protein
VPLLTVRGLVTSRGRRPVPQAAAATAPPAGPGHQRKEALCDGGGGGAGAAAAPFWSLPPLALAEGGALAQRGAGRSASSAGVSGLSSGGAGERHAAAHPCASCSLPALRPAGMPASAGPHHAVYALPAAHCSAAKGVQNHSASTRPPRINNSGGGGGPDHPAEVAAGLTVQGARSCGFAATANLPTWVPGSDAGPAAASTLARRGCSALPHQSARQSASSPEAVPVAAARRACRGSPPRALPATVGRGQQAEHVPWLRAYLHRTRQAPSAGAVRTASCV